jgi:hypothetical protein
MIHEQTLGAVARPVLRNRLTQVALGLDVVGKDRLPCEFAEFPHLCWRELLDEVAQALNHSSVPLRKRLRGDERAPILHRRRCRSLAAGKVAGASSCVS